VDQILNTKFFVPTARPELVSRSRLIEQLNNGLHRKLTLISAPAGFGKTTLVGEWMDTLQKGDKKDHRIAWLSLDEGDNELTRFLTYFASALNRIKEMKTTVGEESLSLLQSPQPPPAETVLTSLINEIAAVADKIIFILDDYHLIETQPIHDALGFTLENLPPQLHLVIATREDPLLPLSRLRARDQLTELRAVDLRFTSTEATEFLNHVMALNLSVEEITTLENRTEGWIAGLQLAAVSLQGQADTSSLIRSFAGSNRLVLDYLIEEVLEHQPSDVQNFLLQTCILNRLTGSLCDAITGQDNGQQVLEILDHANLFIVPLDEERRWYRYHHLFADLLRQRLQQTRSEQLPNLHLKASGWYETKGQWSDAVRHAFAAGDLERAADLIELAWVPMNTSYRSITWLGWAKTLPNDLVHARPLLSTACGWASLDAGELEAAELCFQNAERWLEAVADVNGQFETSSGRTVELDEKELRSLSISIANGRAYLAQALGDVTGTVKYARRANGLLHENEYFERGLSDVLIGFAYWSSGDLDAAHGAIADAISKMWMTEKKPFIISFTSYLADVMKAQGRLHEVERTYLQLLETFREQGESGVKETAVLHLGLSELYLERGDMETAMQHLQRSEELGEQPSFPPWYRHWICAHVNIMAANGDLDGVIELLKGAKRYYYRHPIPDVRPLAALNVRALLAQGKMEETLHWVHEQSLSIDDELNYLHEFEHITLVRLLIAQYQNGRDDADIQGTLSLLDRLLAAAKEGGRMGSVIEILVLQALAYDAKDDVSHALVPLEQALMLAEPEGYFRIFVDEGPPMARLLHDVLSHKIAPDYVKRLLAAFPDDELKKSGSSQSYKSGSELIEPLSERELEILQLVADGQSNWDIGAQLFLSLNTVKAHTRNIYGKLGVNSRTQAAARARAMGIISDS